MCLCGGDDRVREGSAIEKYERYGCFIDAAVSWLGSRDFIIYSVIHGLGYGFSRTRSTAKERGIWRKEKTKTKKTDVMQSMKTHPKVPRTPLSHRS